MRRTVSAALALDAAGPARLILAVSVAGGYDTDAETLTITQAEQSLAAQTLEDEHGSRLHVVDVATGRVDVEYSASVIGTVAPQTASPLEEIRYLRPSRYCESDALAPTAFGEFGGLHGEDLLAAVSSWVGVRLDYVPGSSLPTDGAVRTLLSRKGVCRDYAHLVVAFLRALDVPARVAAVYAPGLSPMDFHAVAEAAIDGVWRVVDATTLAPRDTLVRIATGRDAADTAFLTIDGAPVELLSTRVTAVADTLPEDDVRRLVSLR